MANVLVVQRVSGLKIYYAMVCVVSISYTKCSSNETVSSTESPTALDVWQSSPLHQNTTPDSSTQNHFQMYNSSELDQYPDQFTQENETTYQDNVKQENETKYPDNFTQENKTKYSDNFKQDNETTYPDNFKQENETTYLDNFTQENKTTYLDYFTQENEKIYPDNFTQENETTILTEIKAPFSLTDFLLNDVKVRNCESSSYSCSLISPTCYCDDKCYFFKDCCFSRIKQDVFLSGENISITQVVEGHRYVYMNDTSWSVFRPEHFQCVANVLDKGSIRIITSCPDTGDTETALQYKCSSSGQYGADYVPVDYISNGTYIATFKNIHCARCHRITAEQVTFWYMQGTCDNTTEMISDVDNWLNDIPDTCEVTLMSEYIESLRRCSKETEKLIGSDPEHVSSNMDIQTLCEVYILPMMIVDIDGLTVAGRFYRNLHCMSLAEIELNLNNLECNAVVDTAKITPQIHFKILFNANYDNGNIDQTVQCVNSIQANCKPNEIFDCFSSSCTLLHESETDIPLDGIFNTENADKTQTRHKAPLANIYKAVSPFKILTYVSSSISIISSLAVVAANFALRGSRNLQSLSITILSIFLLLFHVMMVTQDLFSTSSLCVCLALITQFLMNSILVWMNIIGVDMFRTLSSTVSYIPRNNVKRFLKRFAFAVMVTTTAVCIPLTFEYTNVPEFLKPHYGRSGICWMTNQMSINIFVIMPVGVAMTISSVMLILSIWSIRRQAQLASIATNSCKRLYIIVYLKMCLILGLPWVLGPLGSLVRADWFWYIHVTFNGLQGLSMFLCWVVNKRFIRKTQTALR